YAVHSFHDRCERLLRGQVIDLFLHSAVCGGKLAKTEVEVELMAWNERRALRGKTLVDGSGEAVAAKLFHFPLALEVDPQCASLSFQMGGVDDAITDRELHLMANAAIAVDDELRRRVRLAITTGTRREGRASMKLTLLEA